jgi:hypothetical protein
MNRASQVAWIEILALRRLTVIIGVILALGGALKLYDSATAFQADDGATFLMLVFGEVELLGGLWLLSGWYTEQTRPWVAAAFAGLAAASVYQIVIGEGSCGYWGSLAVSPWIALVFDLVVIAGLLVVPPPVDWNVRLSENPVRNLGLALTALAIGNLAVDQRSLVRITGMATLNGRPLEGATLRFSGNSGTVELRTGRGGYFRATPARLGRYSVTLLHTVSSDEEDSRDLPYFQPNVRSGKRKGSAPPKQRPIRRVRPRLITEKVVLDITNGSESSVTVNFRGVE